MDNPKRMLGRRDLIHGIGALGLLATLPRAAHATEALNTSDLADMTVGVRPIDTAERAARLARARALMAAHDIDAILVEPGASLAYFTGIQWWRS